MKWLYRILKFLGVLIVVILLFLIVSIIPIKDSSLEDAEGYKKSLASIEQWQFTADEDTLTPFKVGWAKENITPEEVSPMAGYRYRSAFDAVHDSLFCRVFVFKKGEVKAALVTVDLLIFPPSVITSLKERLKQTAWKFDELYLSASHTHNGAGNWAKGAYGLFVSGGYEQAYVDRISKSIISAIHQAEANVTEGKMGMNVLEAPDLVRNRLTDKGKENAQFKWIKFETEDSTKAILASFTAHPTTISSKHHMLSNDYPYYLENYLLQNSDIEMAAFFAGPMGSHGPEGQKGGAEDYFSLPKKIGESLGKMVLKQWDSVPITSPNSLSIDKVPIYLEDLHIRVLPALRTRGWLFEALTEPQDLYIDVLKIDALTMLSTPCDFSGELVLDMEKKIQHQNIMINNFNGGYVGYITPDKYYFEVAKPETMEMNWLGPNNGSMMSDFLLKILEKTEN